MRNVLGLEVGRAVELLALDGVETTLVEVCSRKGVRGNERRVVRMLPTGESKAELTWANFITDVSFVPEDGKKID